MGGYWFWSLESPSPISLLSFYNIRFFLELKLNLPRIAFHFSLCLNLSCWARLTPMAALSHALYDMPGTISTVRWNLGFLKSYMIWLTWIACGCWTQVCLKKVILSVGHFLPLSCVLSYARPLLLFCLSLIFILTNRWCHSTWLIAFYTTFHVLGNLLCPITMLGVTDTINRSNSPWIQGF